MTAPRKQNGRHVAAIFSMCGKKRRYPDELTARAAGQYLEAQEGGGLKLWVYRCPVCQGHHLTSKRGKPEAAVSYSF